MDKRYFSAEKNFKNRRRSSLGENNIRDIDKIVHKVYESEYEQIEFWILLLDLLRLTKKFLISSTDNTDLIFDSHIA